MAPSQEIFDAVYARDPARVRALIQAVPPLVDGADGVHAMRIAIQRCDCETALAFLDGGASPNLRDGERSTPLMWASASGCAPLVRRLLDRGADIEAADQFDWTAIFHAAAAQQLDTVRLLLDRGADIRRTDFEGHTVIDIARFRTFQLRLPWRVLAAGRVMTFRDTPVRALLKRGCRGR